MWNQFILWSGIALSEGSISLADKARILVWALPLIFRHRVTDPVTALLHRRLPVRFLTLRLRRHDGAWWMVPSDKVGVHASRRLGGKGWREGDFILIAGRSALASGWIEDGKLESEVLQPPVRAPRTSR